MRGIWESSRRHAGASAPGVIIVNKAMARSVWNTTDVIGRQFDADTGTRKTLTIVGIASDARLMAVDVATHERSVDIGVARHLVRILVSPVGGGYGYDVSPDGKRILVLSDGRVGAQQPLTLVQNWPSTLP